MSKDLDSLTEVSVRPATQADVPRIIELQLELGAHHRELEQDNLRYQIDEQQWRMLIDKALGTDSTRFLVAIQDERVCGFVKLSMVDKPWGVGCEMDTLVVETSARGSGIGQQLVEAAESAARKAGARAIRANVLSRNTRGQQFYASNGYSEIAVRFGKTLE